MTLLQQGQYDEACGLCQQLLTLHPDLFAARHLLGVALLRQGRLDAAEQALQQACRGKAPARQRAQAWNNLALCRQHRHKPDAALAAIDEALGLERGEAAFWLNRGNILEVLQDWPQMRAALQQALTLAPGLDEARIGLAVACRQLGRLSEARAQLEAVIEQDYDWLREYALLLLLQQDREQALALCAQVPDSDSLQGVADYIAEAGHPALATPLYRRVLERDPDNACAAHMLDALTQQPSERAPRAYVEALYDQHAGAFEQRLVGQLGYRAPELMATALAEVPPARLSPALDLGCGSGLLGQALLTRFPAIAIDGIDLSAGMLEQARHKGCYRRLWHGDAAEILQRLPAQHYRLIASTDMLIYLGDLTPLFAAVARGLHPDGLFAFTVETGAGDRPQLHRSGRFRHGADYLERLAREQGLRIRSLEAFPLRRENAGTIEGLMLILERPPAGTV